MSPVSILLTGFLVAVAGVIVGFHFRRQLPAKPVGRIRLSRPSIASASFAALTVVYFEALFRAGRLAGLYEFDAWSFWVPKAKAIYLFGGLDGQFFRELPNQVYPPLLPALEAATFNFMGSMDVVTLHLQFWFLLVGFVSAVAGLLAGKVPTFLVWAPMLLVLVTPHVIDYVLQPQADFLLDELFALAVLLVALWLLERADWLLAVATPLVGAAMLTKREGYMFGASLVLAAVIVSLRKGRAVWARLILVEWSRQLSPFPGASFCRSGTSPPTKARNRRSTLGSWTGLALAPTLSQYPSRLPYLAYSHASLCASNCHGLCWRRTAHSCLCSTSMHLLRDRVHVEYMGVSQLSGNQQAALNPIVRLTGGLVLCAVGLVPLLLRPPLGTRGDKG